MFELWREGRKLGRQYDAFLKNWKRLIKEKSDGGDYKAAFEIVRGEPYNTNLRRLQLAIRSNKSARLIRKAKRLGIDVRSELPEDARYDSGQLIWWDENEEQVIFIRSILSERGLDRLGKLISDKQYELAKKWTDLLAPMFSTIISLIALFLAALALYLQTLSDPIIIVPPPR